MKLGDLWRRWQTRGYPEHMLTEAEAIERVRQYAEANGRSFYEAGECSRGEAGIRSQETGRRASALLYVMVLGTTIPMPTVEVDSTDGRVLCVASASAIALPAAFPRELSTSSHPALIAGDSLWTP